MKRIEHKRLAALLRIGLVIAAVVCAAIFFWFLPELGRGIAAADPEFAWAFWQTRLARIPAVFGTLRPMRNWIRTASVGTWAALRTHTKR